MSDLTPYSMQWANNPEPDKHEGDGCTILDANIPGQAWLFNTENESTEWLTFEGEMSPVER